MKTAYPRFRSPVDITLYSNIPFDNTYSHHSLISSLFKYGGSNIFTGTQSSLACERFIDRKDYSKVGNPYYYPRYIISGEYNFDYSNGLVCSVVLELTPAQTNANYMKVVAHGQDSSDIYYYFITGITQLNADTYRLSLELDVLMTYQDEFLTGIKDVPIFTERKHCHRFNGNYVFSPDYKSGEELFAGIKPSIINATRKPDLDIDDDQTNLLFSNMLWLYVVCDLTDGNAPCYHINGKMSGGALVGELQNPFLILCAPLSYSLNLYGSGSPAPTYEIRADVKKLVNAGNIKGCKVSPYPPFDYIPNNFARVNSTYDITIHEVSSGTDYITYTGGSSGQMCIGNNVFDFGDGLYGDGGTKDDLLSGWLVIRNQGDFEHKIDSVSFTGFNYGTLSITSSRRDDPKLLFSPFRKYSLTSPASGEIEFYPELAYSYVPLGDNLKIDLVSIETAYGGDFTNFTYIKEIQKSGKYAFRHYKDAKIGLSQSPNYTIPVGTDALDVFKSTQAETFYQSKIASGITSGLTIAGGVGSVALGVAGAVGSMGMSTPVSVGLIAGGIGSIAGGTASLVNTIKSSEAKIEDLENTPNTINTCGSSYAHDIAMNINRLLPYFVTYVCSETTKEKANDYFYNYGYGVARECHFNLDIYIENDGDLDNNLLGRTIFNYIKLNEDITNKIDANIPVIVKQKLSSILNNGVTLWSFFGFSGLWNDNTPTSTYYISRWLFKHDLENYEYSGSVYQ